jgi:plastocyanin
LEAFMQLVRMAALGAALVLVAGGALACGDDDDNGGDDGGDEPRATATAGSTPQATSANGSPAAGGDAVTITAADFSFSPAATTVDGTTDTTITLNNTGDLPHTLHVYYDAAYTDLHSNTGNVSPGASEEVSVTAHSVEAAQELFFRCNVHPDQMEGTITVTH